MTFDELMDWLDNIVSGIIGFVTGAGLALFLVSVAYWMGWL